MWLASLDRYREFIGQERVHPHHAPGHDQHPPWTYCVRVLRMSDPHQGNETAVWIGCCLIALKVYELVAWGLLWVIA